MEIEIGLDIAPDEHIAHGCHTLTSFGISQFPSRFGR